MIDLRDGETALDIAEKKKNTEIVAALESKIEENKKEEEDKLKEEEKLKEEQDKLKEEENKQKQSTSQPPTKK